MRTTLSILIARTVAVLCKLFKPVFKKEGSVLPGRCVLKVHKKVLDKIKYPKYVVAVSGSSGKGSTVSMVAHILEQSGKKVVWNKSGSNVTSAIVTLVLKNTKAFSHKVDADVLLLEMDERFIKGTFKPGTITHLAITNITRDQPSRNLHTDVIYEKILSSIDSRMHLILNADDPIVAKMRFIHGGKVTMYGIDKSKSDYKDVPNYAIDAAYCPSCKTKLKYKSYHYGHLGLYDCPRCSFGRGKLDYEARHLDLEKGTLDVDGDVLHLNKKVFFAAYYTLLAYTICNTIGIDKDDILREINEDELSSKRGKVYEVDGRSMEMLESKNENSLSYMQSIDYISSREGKKTIIMGFENVSRRYRYNDLSWLWDIDFSSFKDDSVDKIFCIGRFKYDVATRLSYDGIDEDKLVLVDNLSNLIEEVKIKSEGSIYTMVCFDMTAIIKSQIEGESK